MWNYLSVFTILEMKTEEFKINLLFNAQNEKINLLHK